MENAVVAQKQKGLTGFTLKIIALVCMLIDHIQYFFEFTGAIPIWFGWIGRLAGPLFLFTVVEGFAHTRSRKKYFLRVWGMSVAMGAVNYALMLIRPRGDGFTPQNNIFATFALLMVLWQGIDWLRAKRWMRGLAAALIPFALLAGFALLPQSVVGWAYIVEYILVPLPMLTEGGIPFLVGGLILYLLRRRRGWQVGVWALWTLAWNAYAMVVVGGDLAWWFTEGYEWMGIFAGVFMLAYNGQRGRGAKNLFYIFYPAHVYILYAASVGVYALTMG